MMTMIFIFLKKFEMWRLAAGTDELKLEVARTCHVLAMDPTPDAKERNDAADADSSILVGYLWKKSQSAGRVSSDDASAVWHRRWFCLRRDNYCLYYYKNQDVS